MRVLVACDAIAGLSPRAGSEVIARAFAEAGAEVAVIPVGSGGDPLADALSTLDPTAALVAVTSPGDLLDVLVAGEGALVLDLTGMAVPRPGELIALATPERISAARGALAGREVVAVVEAGQELWPLTGLSGAVAELGRRRGADLAETLAEDSGAEKWAAASGMDPLAPGAGALGGAGAVVRAVGGRVTSGLDFCLEGYGAARVLARADVAVTGAAQLDFHAVGGPVVAAMAKLAADTLRPLVAVAGRTFVSSRELRLAGIEAAYPVLSGAGPDEPDEEQLFATAQRVAATWRW